MRVENKNCLVTGGASGIGLAEVDAAFARTKETWGGVDIVFNNAGVGGMQPAEDYADDDFLRVIDINLNGVFRVARAALRIMYSQGSGSIINCASILGMLGQSQTAAYTAAVVFLGSEEASFITGTTLMVDGGFTAGKS